MNSANSDVFFPSKTKPPKCMPSMRKKREQLLKSHSEFNVFQTEKSKKLRKQTVPGYEDESFYGNDHVNTITFIYSTTPEYKW